MARFTYHAVTPSTARPASRTVRRAPAVVPEVVRQRSGPRAADALLSAAARAWLEALPLRPRPEYLCARYPRVANRLALVWEDAELSRQLFDELLGDDRGGRKGFPAPVLAELRLLHEINDARLIAAAVDAPMPAWAEVSAPSATG